MADNDLFNKNTDNALPPQNDEELIKTLVGDGKPYKTTADLAKGKLQADIHIKRVETENKELREKLASAKTVDDVLAAVKANVASEDDNSDKDLDNSSAPAPGLSAEQVAKIVAEQITGHETIQKKTQNKDRANKAMFELYGEKAQEVFEKEASTPELRNALIALAEIDPEKFVTLFKKDAQKGPAVDNEGKNINALNLQQSTGSKVPGTQAYYSALRKSSPALYWSPKTQLEMHDSALRDPDKYFGRA